jgi:hypothetical protein
MRRWREKEESMAMRKIDFGSFGINECLSARDDTKTSFSTSPLYPVLEASKSPILDMALDLASQRVS